MEVVSNNVAHHCIATTTIILLFYHHGGVHMPSVVVAVGRDGVEHANGAVGQGNVQELMVTDEWFGDAIFVWLTGDIEFS